MNISFGLLSSSAYFVGHFFPSTTSPKTTHQLNNFYNTTNPALKTWLRTKSILMTNPTTQKSPNSFPNTEKLATSPKSKNPAHPFLLLLHAEVAYRSKRPKPSQRLLPSSTPPPPPPPPPPRPTSRSPRCRPVSLL